MAKQWKRSLLAYAFLLAVFGIVTCVYDITKDDNKPDKSSVQGLYGPEDRTWTANSIPMPHLSDGYRYVSNPDGILSDSIVNCIDNIMWRMDNELGIESAVIVVNHVADRDIFRFAQDIFDKYGVGKDDRGLVLVLAYGDHLVRTHTGRSLEAELTDAECRRVQDKYLLPYVKKERPNAGMLNWTYALYDYMKDKQSHDVAERTTPTVIQLANIDESSATPFNQVVQSDEEEDEDLLVGIGMVLFIVFIMILYYYIKGDLFSGSSGGGYSSSSYDYDSGSSSSSRSSGGYSGGSSGGGGATSSW